MKKNKRIIFATIAALSLAAPMTAVFNFDNVQTVSANHQGTKVWLQYGTLKYALKGPSGRVYPAGTKVVREMGAADTKPNISFPGRPFNLTWMIGGLPNNQRLQDVGGGRIAETYVNYEDWQEIDYPSDNVVLVQNTEDYTDLKSSDFHPVDSSNPDVPVANTDKLDETYADYDSAIDFSKLSKKDGQYVADLRNRYFAAKSMGATQETVDALTKEINDAVANYKKTGHLVSGNSNSGNSSNSSNSNSGSTTVTPAKRKSRSRFVKLRKASYQYTHKGKRVSKKKLKKGTIVKINGKTYRIKKKTFYRIGKNRYIRKVNVAKK
ncbi:MULTISPECIES: SLAP domain-containing protein [Lactobacillus]|uniref:SLAP domain-containing protein n=1 Tax=Lactobacillus TaxID=1578 RepID=UPI000D6FB613|nr:MULTISPECIES: SLAP domain-containing protein [Lactobacillus]AWN33294.1 hypothetical protein DLD54_03600 [Lactobacillus helsingborgensis]RMC53758.1 hypothetical protein F5ESL0262_03560 [Lactobacillus sp. ESL0262]